ncbi:MAG TPA: hypothetical protein VGS27_10775 [Candidatus Sulfotelmatobacter sp.]|nr:hypothetical protein [Candidatus Sulfotelmatobacter sp.]
MLFSLHRAHTINDPRKFGKILKPQSPFQKRIIQTYAKPSFAIYVRQNVVVQKAPVFDIEPGYKSHKFTLAPDGGRFASGMCLSKRELSVR